MNATAKANGAHRTTAGRANLTPTVSDFTVCDVAEDPTVSRCRRIGAGR